MESSPEQTSPLPLKHLRNMPIVATKLSNRNGNVHLVRFHDVLGDCYITRLPNNLLRLLISYNTITELLCITLTCKRFSQFLFDKYINFSGDGVDAGFFVKGNFSYQEHFDLVRKKEILDSQCRVKIHASLSPEFTSIFHVNPRKETFYSYGNGEILEGELVRYNDSMGIKGTRPCISGVLVWDVAGETIACASMTQVAISPASSPLRVSSVPPNSPPPCSIRLLGSHQILLIHRQSTFETWSELLQLLSIIKHEGAIVELQVPDQKLFSFSYHSGSGYLCGYHVSIEGKFDRVWQWTRQVEQGAIGAYNMVTIRWNQVLVVLFRSGKLYANEEEIRKPGVVWTNYSVISDKLIAGSMTRLFVFAYTNGHFKSIRMMHLLPSPSQIDYIAYSRMKAVAVYTTPEGHLVNYSAPHIDWLQSFYTLNLPTMTHLQVQVYKEILVLKGSFRISFGDKDWTIPCIYLLNFNLNSMLTRDPDLLHQATLLAQTQAEEQTLLRLKRMQIKQKAKEEKAQKASLKAQKHRPKH